MGYTHSEVQPHRYHHTRMALMLLLHCVASAQLPASVQTGTQGMYSVLSKSGRSGGTQEALFHFELGHMVGGGTSFNSCLVQQRSLGGSSGYGHIWWHMYTSTTPSMAEMLHEVQIEGVIHGCF